MKRLFFKICIVVFCISSYFGCSPGKTVTRDTFSIEDDWVVLEKKLGIHPLHIRKNLSCRQIQGNGIWPYRCEIQFDLPVAENAAPLSEIEDSIFDIFQEDNDSIVTLIITAEGYREYKLYSVTAESFLDDVSLLNKLYPEYEFHIYVVKDERWRVYKSYR